jgi:ABC-type uncharacterized transport system permease subunit
VLKVIPIEGVVPATPFIEETARLPFSLKEPVACGVFVMILVVIFAYYLLYKNLVGL